MDKVADLMIAVDKFPVISQESTLREAILTLDKVENEFSSGKRPQRILLVVDGENRVVGKLTPKDVIRGLDPDYAKQLGEHAKIINESYKYLMRSGALHALQELASTPWDDLCVKSRDTKIRDFIPDPPPTQIVEPGDSLNKALHRFIIGKHHSLFVTDGKRLIGLLRFTDVYRVILSKIKYVCYTPDQMDQASP